MKWIKASERLPDKECNYHVKATSNFQGYNHNDTALYKNGKWEFSNSEHYSVVEWLDESIDVSQPDPDWKGKIGEEFIFLNNLYEIEDGHTPVIHRVIEWIEEHVLGGDDLVSQPHQDEEATLATLSSQTLTQIEQKKMKALKLNTQSGDWEGFFIDGKLIEEGHSLGEGYGFYFLLEKAEKYGFKRADVIEKELNDEDEQIVSQFGNFPANLSEFKGNYE